MKPDIQMSESDARDTVKLINRSLNGVRDLIYKLYKQNGWKALGYKSWRECVVKEFNKSESYLYRELATAEVEMNISPIGEMVTLNNLQGRTLSVLKPEEQKEVWEKTKERTGDENPPAVELSKTMDDLPAKQEDQEQPPRTTKRDERLAAASSIVNGNKRIEKLAYEIEELFAHWPEMKPQVAILLRKYLAMAETNPSNVVPMEARG